MVIFSVTGVEVFAIFFPTQELMGVPRRQVLVLTVRCWRCFYPQTEQVTGVVQVSSLVLRRGGLTFAAALVGVYGTWKLRVWNL